MVDIQEEVVRSAKARVGCSLGGMYILDSLLGVGGQAAVYSATHRDGSRVAVKMLHKSLSTDNDVRKRFLREGYVSNAVHHVGVPRVLGDGVHADGSIFLVMDLLIGASAETIAKWHGGRVDIGTVVGIAYQLLDVVATAHDSGVIHRDIKPGNISLTRDGVVKLLDFGVARMSDAATATRDGTTIGTPAFMSPEQALGKVKQIDCRSDIYSVGAVMFTMLSGLFVHSGESANELMIRAATCRAPSLADVVSDVPASIVHVVDRALMFEKQMRWSSALQMREALKSAFEEAFSEPIPSGKSLASVLDGIEVVDFPALAVGDGWPTLLAASGERKAARDDPVIELSVTAHSGDDSVLAGIWDDNTEVWEKNPFAKPSSDVKQKDSSSRTSGEAVSIRSFRAVPMLVLFLAISVVLLGAWLFANPTHRTELSRWMHQNARKTAAVLSAQTARESVGPALKIAQTKLFVPVIPAVQPVDVYTLPAVRRPGR